MQHDEMWPMFTFLTTMLGLALFGIILGGAVDCATLSPADMAGCHDACPNGVSKVTHMVCECAP